MANPHNRPQSCLVSLKALCQVHYSYNLYWWSHWWIPVMALAWHCMQIMSCCFELINSSEDFITVQGEIDTSNDRSTTTSLILNMAKCKRLHLYLYHHFCLKTALRNSCTHIDISVSSLDMISLGGTYQSYLSLLSRRFYSNTPGDSLLQLYLSLVRPHVGYASAIWSPHLWKDKDALENIQ